MISFNCLKCSTLYKVGDERAGHRARCPKCKEVVVVPIPDLPEAPPAPPPSAPPASTSSPVAPVPRPAPRKLDGSWATTGVLVAAGIIVVIVLLVQQSQKRDRDLRQMRVDNAVGSFKANMNYGGN